MTIEATSKTAMLTGAWTALGMLSLEAWENSRTVDVATHNTLFLVFGVIFLFAPVVLFVIGPKYLRVGFPWPHVTPGYLAEFRSVVSRMFFWLLGAAIGSAAFSLLKIAAT